MCTYRFSVQKPGPSASDRACLISVILRHALSRAWSLTLSLSSILMLGLMLAGCLSFNPAWTYPDPPKIDDNFTLKDKIIWCESAQGARYTAITGWFGPGCHYTQLNKGHCKAAQLSHEEFDTTKVIIVRCLGEDVEIWLPLPSHKWA